MEGHSEQDHSEKTEQILEALAKRHSYSNLKEADLQSGPHSSPLKRDAPSTVAPSQQAPVEEGQPQRVVVAAAPHRAVDTNTVMEADDALLEMLEMMNSRISGLTSTVDSLASRVEGMTGQNDQPVLMIPQRVRTQMNERIGHLHTNVTSIQTRVDALANQAQSPILMVPQFAKQ